MRSVDIMEEISKSYLELLANRQGYFNFNGRDYGTDLLIRKAHFHAVRKRYLTTGRAIDFQVKSVLEKNITYAPSTINFYLEVKNFDDLVDRKREKGALIPLILIVFILPDSEDEWVTVTPEKLIVKKCAYWFKLDVENPEYSENKTKVVVRIPKVNIVDLKLFDRLFDEL
jgi:hypothetical protein